MLDLALGLLTSFLVGGAALAARRRSRGLAVLVVVALVAWLGLAAGLAHLGVLAVWGSKPPRLVALPLTFLSAMLLLSRTRTVHGLLAGIPPYALVGVQTFRLGVELVLYELHREGIAPVQMTFEGRNLDILVGLTAPLVAWALARAPHPRLALAWNLAGLAILANTIGTAVTSVPGPLYASWPDAPFTALATFPLVWLPAFLAPAAVFLHVVALRQALASTPAVALTDA